MNQSQQPIARVLVEAYTAPVSAEETVVSFGDGRLPAILESLDSPGGYGRYSVYCCDPVEVFQYASVDDDPFGPLEDVISRYPRVLFRQDQPPFVGGWIGYFAYEAGLAMEGMSPHPSTGPGIPAIRFALYDAAAVYDHRNGTWQLVVVDWPEPWAQYRPSTSDRLKALRKRLDRATPLGDSDDRRDVPADTPIPDLAYQEYTDRVHRIQRLIEAGDIYQANLTMRFQVRTRLTPLGLYRRLRQANPSSHAAFLSWNDTSILCSSPELFLDLRDRQVITRPIKGTRPRSTDQVIDKAHREELIHSEKDQAELAMIVDVLRNDLGRVCEFGTVQVHQAGDIETHATVFHKVATITGRLADGKNWGDLLRASFPGGSITGAPKIRAMQVINELEPTRRGVYCGSIGWIGLDGSLDLNIAIRTMVQHGDVVHIHAGGGIVADSVAEMEYEELLAKAEGMFLALAGGVCSPHDSLRKGVLH